MQFLLKNLKQRISVRGFVAFHTCLIIGWGLINVLYYPTLKNHVLYLWLLPSLYAAMFFPVRVYVITLLQEMILSIVVVYQNPGSFFTSLHTILFVNGLLLIVFEFIFQLRRKQEQFEERYEKEISIYRKVLTHAKFVPYERDYSTNTYSFIGEHIESLTGYPKEKWTPDFWDYISTIEMVLGDAKGLAKNKAIHEARHGHLTTWMAECLLTVPNNRQRWILNSAVEIKNEKGHSLRSIGFLQDITEQKLNEHLMQSQNEVLEMIISHEPLIRIAETLVLKFEEIFPQSYCSMLRYDEKNNRLHNLASPSLPIDYVQLIDGLQAGPKQGSCGTAVYTKQKIVVTDTYTDPLWDGYHHVAEKFRLRTCWSVPIISGQGGVFGTFAIYYTNSREPLQEELDYIHRWTRIAMIAFEASKSDQKLRDNEQWFRAMIEHASDAVFVFNTEGFMQYASPACESLTGFKPDELLKTHYQDIAHPEDLEAVNQGFTRMLTNFSSPPKLVQIRIRHKDRQWIHVETVGRNMLRIPAVGGLVVNIRDITDRKVAEEALRSQQEQLWRSQKLESLGRLTKGISHEFNNLFTKIYGNCELIMMQKNMPDDAMKRIEMIYDSVRNASALTNQLKTFSRQKSDAAETFDINQLIQDNYEIIKRILTKSISVHFQLADFPINICAGKNQIQQILINLTMNAHEALPEQGQFILQTHFVSINNHHQLADGDYLKLLVSDTGKGMDEQTKQSLFDPFYTTKESIGSRGMGLAIVYGIVEQYMGMIECVSVPNKGTAIIIYLPALPANLPTHFLH